MTTTRAMPPPDADERSTLEGWLEFYRATVVLKCDGLTEEQLRTPAAAPSPLTLQGLVQHLAEVERGWFRNALAGEQLEPVHGPKSDPDGPDEGFDLLDDVPFAAARAAWETEVEAARRNCASRELSATVAARWGPTSLRWIYNHMIGEYARHAGHADLLRERLDGVTGV
jgi:uncharacterized damage-inducible protein DinB